MSSKRDRYRASIMPKIKSGNKATEESRPPKKVTLHLKSEAIKGRKRHTPEHIPSQSEMARRLRSGK